MTPSFFALFTKAGIACAADADHTLHRLSAGLPVAVAVNPDSPIPFGKIMERFREEQEHVPQAFFINYANEFDVFLSGIEADPSWKDLSPEETNIIFLGYGTDDIFPSAYDVYVRVDENGMLGLSDGPLHPVTLDEPVLIHMLGDFDCVSPMLYGASEKARAFFRDRYRPVWEGYTERVAEQVRGKAYEERIKKAFRDHDYVEDVERRMESVTSETYEALMTGIGTFSVEDMVTAAEAIVEANSRLGHLRSGEPGNPGGAKEIAVVTIPEGISWIKHNENERREQA